jgi:hypothetical protein
MSAQVVAGAVAEIVSTTANNKWWIDHGASTEKWRPPEKIRPLN